jgi:DNA-directed RNA polymerase specialized sigma24 family protein
MGLLFDSGDRAGTDAVGGLPVRAWEFLQPLLSDLPERERIAVMLRFRDAIPQSCIATRMGVPAAQVERLLGTALARLRDQI